MRGDEGSDALFNFKEVRDCEHSIMRWREMWYVDGSGHMAIEECDYGGCNEDSSQVQHLAVFSV